MRYLWWPLLRHLERQATHHILTGKKPVGTFARKSKWIAGALAKLLQSRGLTTWKGKNKWGMHVVIACLQPDTFIPEAEGTPREVAFTRAFIDEELPFAVIGALYGYPSCGLYSIPTSSADLCRVGIPTGESEVQNMRATRVPS